MDHFKISRAFVAALTASEIFWTSLHGRQEPGIVPDKSFEMKQEHTEREGQETIRFPREQVTSPTSGAPFIPSSYDPSAMVIRARKKYIDDYYACVLSSSCSPHLAPLAWVSSQSASS
jgi:hypothetical protein